MGSFHFIGIKGSGMSALAQVLHDLNHDVQGEDITSLLFTQTALEARSIPLYAFGEAPLAPGMTAIASNAFDDRHPSIVRCREAGIPVQRYHHFLGRFIDNYTSIAITGAHGKTTTTGMIAHALNTDHRLICLIGDGTGSGHPDGEVFAFESCEYKRHFLAYHPEIAVITNIDFDHPDYFADIDDVRTAFEEMTAQTSKYIVACGDDEQVRMLRTKTDTLYYGLDADNELRGMNVSTDCHVTSFDVYYKNTKIDRFSVPAFGKHNVQNALATIGVALVLDRNLDEVKSRLATFAGVKRRFTETAWRSNIVIDDYAHHPSEIKATFEAARSKYPGRRVIGIFQPHTFSRLEKLLEDFALSLREADELFLCPIFGSARENTGRVSIADLQQRIPHARLVSEDIAADLRDFSEAVLVFMGAGDIQKYQAQLVRV